MILERQNAEMVAGPPVHSPVRLLALLGESVPRLGLGEQLADGALRQAEHVARKLALADVVRRQNVANASRHFDRVQRSFAVRLGRPSVVAEQFQPGRRAGSRRETVARGRRLFRAFFHVERRRYLAPDDRRKRLGRVQYIATSQLMRRRIRRLAQFTSRVAVTTNSRFTAVRLLQRSRTTFVRSVGQFH